MKNVPTRKLCDALFRGKDFEHVFKVYPLKAAITDQAAVFIISRRVTDRLGKGHHVTVCIGETDSTDTEFKRHRRSQCVKDHGANVICILKERHAETRRDVLADLTTNRSFSCIRNKYKPKMKASAQAATSPRSTTSNAKSLSNKSPVKPAGDSGQRAAASKIRTRVQSGVDSDRRQHRLSKPKRTVARKAKGRTAGVSRTGKKAAA